MADAKKPQVAAVGGEPVDEYEEYNYEADKLAAGSGHSGKCRTKKEAELHTNRPDPGGHTRKTTQKLINSHEKEKEERRASTGSGSPTEKSTTKKS
jgi:nuclear protein 1